MEWAIVDLPGVEDLIEFESRVNYVVPKYENAVVCAYDLTKFGASVMIDAFKGEAEVIGVLLEGGADPTAGTPSAYLHRAVTASGSAMAVSATTLRVQEFDKGRGPVGLPSIG